MWTPRPKYKLHCPGKKKPHCPPPFIYTVHRPHAAPKGQGETLIRGGGRIHQNKKGTASMGAEEPEQAEEPQLRKLWRTTPPPLAQALH